MVMLRGKAYILAAVFKGRINLKVGKTGRSQWVGKRSYLGWMCVVAFVFLCAFSMVRGIFQSIKALHLVW